MMFLEGEPAVSRANTCRHRRLATVSPSMPLDKAFVRRNSILRFSVFHYSNIPLFRPRPLYLNRIIVPGGI